MILIALICILAWIGPAYYPGEGEPQRSDTAAGNYQLNKKRNEKLRSF